MGSEFTPIFLFIVVAALTALSMWGLSAVLGPKRKTAIKQMPYESGMDPIGDARQRFDVRYYLVAILFIIFDLEVAFLFPWAVSLGDIGAFGFWSMVVFLAVLTIGFVYEWMKGALEWE
jgi:NADH-quinone oxidoreductase subunit A